MKIKLIRFIKVLLGCVLVLLAILGVSRILSYKNPNSHEDFYRNKEDYQILFVGNSHAQNGFSPMTLWKNYGFTSYNIAEQDSYLAEGYWVLVNALDYHKPELVVIDIFEVDMDEKYDTTSAEGLHNGMDAIPMSINKLKMWNDLLKDKNKHLYKDRLDFLFTLRAYHTRWSSLTSADFEEHIDINAGAQTVYRVAKPKDSYTVYTSKEIAKNETISYQYLVKIIELCKEEGIEVILTNLSFNASDEMVPYLNKAQKLAEDYAVDFIDYVHINEVVNPITDYFTNSKNTHLNKMGMDKVTLYLGEYIRKNYTLSNEQSDETTILWNQKYEDYQAFKREAMLHNDGELDIQGLYSTLMNLYDDEYSACIAVKADSKLYEDVVFAELLKSIKNKYKITEDENLSANDYYFLVVDHQLETSTEYVGNGYLELDTSFGRVNYSSFEEGVNSLYDENWDVDYYMPLSENEADIKLLIIDTETGNKLVTQEYYLTDSNMTCKSVAYESH